MPDSGGFYQQKAGFVRLYLRGKEIIDKEMEQRQKDAESKATLENSGIVVPGRR